MSVWLRRPEALPSYFARNTEPAELALRPAPRAAASERWLAILACGLPTILTRAGRRSAAAW